MPARKGGEFHIVPHGSQFPASCLRGQRCEKSEEGQGTHMGCGQVQPAGCTDLGIASLQTDQKIGADRKEFPSKEEVQSIGGSQDEAHACNHGVPPQAAGWGGTGMGRVGPVPDGVDGTCCGYGGKENQKKALTASRSRVRGVPPRRKSLFQDHPGWPVSTMVPARKAVIAPVKVHAAHHRGKDMLAIPPSIPIKEHKSNKEISIAKLDAMIYFFSYNEFSRR